jgi:hypothetical protein
MLPHPLLSGLGFQSLYSSSEVRYRLLNLSTDFVQILSIDLLLIVPSISRITFLYYYTFLNSYICVIKSLWKIRHLGQPQQRGSNIEYYNLKKNPKAYLARVLLYLWKSKNNFSTVLNHNNKLS